MFLCLIGHDIPNFKTVDGFDVANDARLVAPEEYLKHQPRVGVVYNVLANALAAVSDKTGRIVNFEMPKFYETEILPAMGMEPDDVTTPITYDTFTSAFLTEALLHMAEAGYLAHRGNGDSVSYHLALPTKSAPRAHSSLPQWRGRLLATCGRKGGRCLAHPRPRTFETLRQYSGGEMLTDLGPQHEHDEHENDQYLHSVSRNVDATDDGHIYAHGISPERRIRRSGPRERSEDLP
ncbi:hypothetical protein [Acrocarpospora pleiomorpha]|uniref:hypothetical protein n=1 Tax=Acrocarpospora pleiomorpha TaxID=90975 RepID=UPI0012D2FA7C|nr:hypothetical protein [Acrocarpospora pleiomorpha]